MYEIVYIKPESGEMNNNKYLCSLNSVTRMTRSESLFKPVRFSSWEPFVNITPVSEIIPEIHMLLLVLCNENFVSRKPTKSNQVGRPTKTVLKAGLNGVQ